MNGVLARVLLVIKLIASLVWMSSVYASNVLVTLSPALLPVTKWLIVVDELESDCHSGSIKKR